MGTVNQGGLVRVAPCFGIEVEAEDEVGLEGVVDKVGAGTDLGGAVKKPLGESLAGGGRVARSAGIERQSL